jgi:hypothetical protein
LFRICCAKNQRKARKLWSSPDGDARSNRVRKEQIRASGRLDLAFPEGPFGEVEIESRLREPLF